MSRYRSKEPNPVAMALVGLLFVIGAVYIIILGNNTKKMEKRCTESAKGIVTNVRSERRTRKSGKHRSTYYVYVTTYSYEANNKQFIGKSTLSEGQKLSEGSEIVVYYNPDKPDEEHRTNYDTTGSSKIAVGILLGVIGGFMLIGSGCSKKKRPRNAAFGGSPVNMRQAAVGAILGAAESRNNNNYNNNNSYNNNFGTNQNFNNNGYNNSNSFGGSYNTGSGNYSSGSFNNSYDSSFGNNNSYNNNYNSYNNNNFSGGSSYGNNDFNQLN